MQKVRVYLNISELLKYANLPTNIIPTKLLDSTFPGKSPWAWEFHPLRLRLCLSQTLWNPESQHGDWPHCRDLLQPAQSEPAHTVDPPLMNGSRSSGYDLYIYIYIYIHTYIQWLWINDYIYIYICCYQWLYFETCRRASPSSGWWRRLPATRIRSGGIYLSKATCLNLLVEHSLVRCVLFVVVSLPYSPH